MELESIPIVKKTGCGIYCPQSLNKACTEGDKYVSLKTHKCCHFAWMESRKLGSQITMEIDDIARHHAIEPNLFLLSNKVVKLFVKARFERFPYHAPEILFAKKNNALKSLKITKKYFIGLYNYAAIVVDVNNSCCGENMSLKCSKCKSKNDTHYAKTKSNKLYCFPCASSHAQDIKAIFEYDYSYEHRMTKTFTVSNLIAINTESIDYKLHLKSGEQIIDSFNLKNNEYVSNNVAIFAELI